MSEGPASPAQEITIQQQVEEEVDRLTIGARKYVFRPEPRCRVCQDENVVALVNRQLALGHSYASILRAIDDFLDGLNVGQEGRPTYNSVYNHAKRHFAVDGGAQKIYREILERRALENDRDFVEGLGNAITPLAYLESLMVGGYQTMTTSGLPIPIQMGMEAAVKLHSLTASDKQSIESTQLIAQMSQVIEAVREVVPPEYWAKIVSRLEGVEGMEQYATEAEQVALDAEVVPDPESEPEVVDPAYDPTAESIDPDDPDSDEEEVDSVDHLGSQEP